MEITQFTYFQQVGGFDCNPVMVELTYGLERLAMYLQGVDNVFDLAWNEKIYYGDVHHRGELEYSIYNFETADIEMLRRLFEYWEKEGFRLFEQGLVLPGYDCCIKCSHIFNILDARKALSVAERTAFIARVRALAKKSAQAWLETRKTKMEK